MKQTLSLLAIAALGAGGSQALSLAQGESNRPSQAEPLTRQLGVEAAWEKALAAPSHADREASYGQLVEAALEDTALRGVLRAWAGDESLGDLAWTARLALREIELRDGRSGAAGRGGGIRSGGRRLDGGLGNDPFGWFDSPFGQFEVFTNPDFMEELRRSMDEALRGFGAPGPGAPGVPGASSQSQSYSMESGPDGVRVEVRTDTDGDSSVTTYAAESLEQLLEEHPELRDKLGLGAVAGAPGSQRPDELLERLFGSRPGLGAPRALQRMRLQPGVPAPLERRSLRGPSGAKEPRALGDDGRPGAAEALRAPDGPTPDGSPRTDRLGVYVANVEDADRAARGLAAGVGLRVEQVLPNSIASLLGIRVGDVVVDVNGTPVRSVADVARALGERADAAPLRVAVVDAGGQRRTLAWEP